MVIYTHTSLLWTATNTNSTCVCLLWSTQGMWICIILMVPYIEHFRHFLFTEITVSVLWNLLQIWALETKQKQVRSKTLGTWWHSFEKQLQLRAVLVQQVLVTVTYMYIITLHVCMHYTVHWKCDTHMYTVVNVNLKNNTFSDSSNTFLA